MEQQMQVNFPDSREFTLEPYPGNYETRNTKTESWLRDNNDRTNSPKIMPEGA